MLLKWDHCRVKNLQSTTFVIRSLSGIGHSVFGVNDSAPISEFKSVEPCIM